MSDGLAARREIMQWFLELRASANVKLVMEHIGQQQQEGFFLYGHGLNE